MSQFKNKTLLITGGTGTFGHVALKRFLLMDFLEIRILSRDEKKQYDMRKKYNNSNLKFYLGDVRDYASVVNACRGVDYIFHAAALKQVPSCEFYPLEAVKTNVMGAENVLEAAVLCNVKNVVCLGTDKAVYPINAMGMSKAMMEKIMVGKSRNLTKDQTVMCGTRYGNIMASRGSVIPLFVSQIMQNEPITITNGHMTRFMLTPEDSVDLVIYAFTHGSNGDIFVQKAPASTIGDIAKAVSEILNCPNHPIITIGTRHGEKLYESLVSSEEMVRAVDCGNYFRIPPDTRDLNYAQYFEKGNSEAHEVTDYNSHNTRRLSLDETRQMILKLPSIQKIINEGTCFSVFDDE